MAASKGISATTLGDHGRREGAPERAGDVVLGAEHDPSDRRPFQPLGQRPRDLLVVQLDKRVLAGGGEVLLDGQLAGLAVAASGATGR